VRRKKKKKRNRRKLRRRRGRGFSNAHLLMIVGCLLKVSLNLQQFKPAKQDINIKLKCKIRRKRPEKLIFFCPTVGAKNVCVIMWPILTLTLQHGHYMRVYSGMNIVLFTRNSACKSTCCLLSKGGCYVRCPQIGGMSNKNP
jgi:hypothetical protein